MGELKELKVGVFRCRCMACRHEFEAFRISDFAYGERLLLTEDGIDYGYLNCFEDKVFDEIDEAVKVLMRDKGIPENEYRKYYDKAFSITCDRVNGKNIDASRISFACPICKSDKVMELDGEAHETRKVAFPVISHEAWNHMDISERKQLLAKA